MPTSLLKQRVRDAFHRAATTYDGAAVMQRRVGDRLLESLTGMAEAPRQILDAGCGTGYGARLLRARWPNAWIAGVDFAPAMLCAARMVFDARLAADIERLPIAPGGFDLWWSNLSIQWCRAEIVFHEAARVLRPHGMVAFSTLCPDTFAELRAAFENIDRHRHTLVFSEPDTLHAALDAAGLRDIRLLRERHTIYYPDLKSLLRSIKAIGAQNVGDGARPGMMGRAAWRCVESAYERFRTPAGLPASYDVLLGYAKK